MIGHRRGAPCSCQSTNIYHSTGKCAGGLLFPAHTLAEGECVCAIGPARLRLGEAEAKQFSTPKSDLTTSECASIALEALRNS